MAYSLDVKGNVRRRYIEGMSLKQAALIDKVPYHTALIWKKYASTKGDNWNDARASYRITNQGVNAINSALVEEIARNCLATQRELKDTNLAAIDKVKLISSLADSYSKFAGAFAKSNPQYNKLSVVLEVLKEVGEYIKEHNPELTESFSEVLPSVGQILSSKYRDE